MKLINTFFTLSLAATTLTGCASSQIEKEVSNSLKVQLQQGKRKLSATYKVDLPAKLSLEEAYALTLKKNPDLRAIKERIKIAQAKLRQAHSTYYPRISANVAAVRQDQIPANQSFAGSPDEVSVYNSSLDMYWLVFDGFTRENRILSAEYGVYTVEQQLDEARRLLLDAVAKAFLRTANSYKLMEISKAEEALSKEFLDQETKKFDAGASNKISVNNFKLRVNNSSISYIQNSRDYRVGLVVLMELMGYSTEPKSGQVKLQLDEKIADKEIPPLLYCITQSYSERPDLKSLEAQISGTKADVKAFKGEYYPKLSIQSSYGGSSYNDFNYSGDDSDFNYGAYLTWDLFSGFDTTEKVKAGNAEVKALEQDRQALRNQVASEVRQTYQSINHTIERLKLEKNNVTLNKEIYEQTNEQYKQGLITLTRVNEVLTDLFVAERAFSVTKVELQSLLEELDAVTGDILSKNVKDNDDE